MSTVKKLQLLMTADASQVQKAAANMESSLKRVEGAVGRMNSGMMAGMGALTGSSSPVDLLKGISSSLLSSIPGVGPAFQSSFMLATNVMEQVYNKVRETQKAILDTGRSAMAAGANVEDYSALLYATGNNAELMDKALFKLNVRISEAAEKGGESAEVFEKLGLNVRELSGEDSVQQFLKFSGALEKSGKGFGEAGKAAHDVWGKLAHEIMPELAKGQDAIQAKMRRAGERGLTVTFEDVAAVKQADRAMKDFDRSTESAWKSFSIGLSPGIKQFAEDMDRLRGAGQGTGKQDVFKNAGTLAGLWVNVAKSIWAGDGVMGGIEATKKQLENFDGSVKKDAEGMSHWAKAMQVAANETKRLKEEQEAANHEVQAATEYFKEANKILEGNETPFESFVRQQEEVNRQFKQGTIFADDQAVAVAKLAEKTVKLNEAQKSLGGGLTGSQFGSAASAADMNLSLRRAQTPDITEALKQAAEDSKNERARLIEIGTKILEKIPDLGVADGP